MLILSVYVETFMKKFKYINMAMFLKKQLVFIRRIMDNNKYYPMNSAELLDMVLDVYKKSFGKQIAVTMIFGMIFSVVAYIVILMGGIGIAISIASSIVAYSNPQDAVFGLLPAIILFIILIVTIMIIYQALITTGNAIITKQTFLNEPTDIGAVLKQTFKKLIPAATAGFANLIVMLPLLVLTGVFIYLYIMMFVETINYNTIPATLTIVATIAIFILMLVVSIICSAITMMGMSAAVFENKYFFSAVKKSYQLAKPDFLKIICLVSVWSLGVSAISYSLTSVLQIAPLFAQWILPQEAAAVISVISMSLTYVLSMAVSVLIAPLSGIFTTLMYINQRFKHEGLDIELNLNEISNKRLQKQYMELQKNAPPTPYLYGYYPGPRQ